MLRAYCICHNAYVRRTNVAQAAIGLAIKMFWGINFIAHIITPVWEDEVAQWVFGPRNTRKRSSIWTWGLDSNHDEAPKQWGPALSRDDMQGKIAAALDMLDHDPHQPLRYI